MTETKASLFRQSGENLVEAVRHDLLVAAVVAENERSGEHPAVLSIMRAYLILLGDKAVLVQKLPSRRR